MSFKTLLEPIIESGIKNTNYFEGRLLSGKDLTEQEQANKQHRQQLGKILGHGVVNGLEVSLEKKGAGAEDPIVRINNGMAITLEGDVVELPINYVDIQLSRSFDSDKENPSGFQDCGELPTQTLVPSGAGLYILVMSPASAYREYAPKSGLQKQGIAQQCGRAYVVEGVQFRLVKFDPAQMPDISNETRNLLNTQYLSVSSPVGSSDLKALSQMRNLVAHICFGTEGIATSTIDPAFINKPDTSIGLDALLGVEEGLASCDTPLALIYWNLEGIVFIDNWAVKRKSSHRDIVAYSIPNFTRQSYSRAEESRLQFQEQLAYLEVEVARVEDTTGFNVKDYFRYLPPTGYLPLLVLGSSQGFSEKAFFQDLSIRNSVFVESSALVPITQVAMTYRPIDLQSGELIWLYRIRENVQTADTDNSNSTQEYLIFASGHTPYFGNARFNVAKWDYSNFGFI